MNKQISKTRQAALDRAQRVANRQQAKIDAAAELRQLKLQAMEYASRLPSNWNDCGTVRLSAWQRFAAYVRKQAERVTIKADELRAVVVEFGKANDWTLERSQEIANTPETRNPK